MNIVRRLHSRPTQDGDGVKIQRVADFHSLVMDPFLMIDELKSDNEADYMGGFPPHPHRGIETFTYIRKGGFEHRDQMGHRKTIGAGDVQWMSTGFGVVHSEMPVEDSDGLHGFQIWLNMPAKDKLRPARYQDSADSGLPVMTDAADNQLRALAGHWHWGDQEASSPLSDLAGQAALADITIKPNQEAELSLPDRDKRMLYVHSGALHEAKAGDLLILGDDPTVPLRATQQGAGVLVLAANPIGEAIAHMGPFVMNTQQELRQAVMDYQAGKMGQI